MNYDVMSISPHELSTLLSDLIRLQFFIYFFKTPTPFVNLVKSDVIFSFRYIYIFFDMSAQEGEGGFELVTSTSLGVVLAD
jgi:hypothetical protein